MKTSSVPRRRLLFNAGLLGGLVAGLHDRSRQRKYRLLSSKIDLKPTDRVLDLGGGHGDFLEQVYPHMDRVVVVDLDWKALAGFRKEQTETRAVCANALKLPFADGTFDLVFSNAVIEHVGDWDCQLQFAQEVCRVSKRFFITTPNKWFPIEQHYRLPFFQFLPDSWQRAIHKTIAIGFIPKDRFEEIHLLSARDLEKLFPDASVSAQRTTFWPESLIALKS